MDRERERGMKENSDKKGGRETDREDHSTGDNSKEVRKPEYLPRSLIPLSSNHTFSEAMVLFEDKKNPSFLFNLTQVT